MWYYFKIEIEKLIFYAHSIFVVMMNPIVHNAAFYNDDDNDVPELIPQPQPWAIIFQPRPWIIIYQEQELEPEEETREESVHKLQDCTFKAQFCVII